MSLEQWLGENAKQVEVVAQRRDADAVVLNRALAIVRQFIADRGLILYGGQAIDYALRLRGTKLYPDYQTPDFDFFSPNNVKDAYDLAEILKKENFNDVKAIVAIHVQTMRVGVESVFVADISYAPPVVFDAIPTVRYKGLKIVHPDYQRTDMHLAFCFPYNDPPREDVFHRFSKDLKRFNMLDELFPIKTGMLGVDYLSEKKLGGEETPKRAFGPVNLDRVAIHGFAAYGLLRAALDELLAATGGKLEKPLPRVDVAITESSSDGKSQRNAHITVGFPDKLEEKRLVVATPWPDEAVELLKAGDPKSKAKVVEYAPYMDTRPPMRVVTRAKTQTEVYSTHDRLLAVSVLAVGKTRATVVSPQYLLLYFLHKALVATGEARDLHTKYYLATLAVLAAADAAIARMRDGGEDRLRAYAKFLDSSPFGLTVRTLGDRNFNESFHIRRATTARGLSGGKLEKEHPTPTNYYLDRAKARPPDFDYNSNPAYIRGGQKI